ncbi:hypothetical protein [Olleya aquimaris]|uniref:Riboflavin synthase subunit beta n=1 Tax=Olleya aquimaris TaxID=639310 RepID=A0A327RLC0_9FLAO|nr:hypothetical protein [Olleya aquimaris]RAJ16782.1 hypothetical protein LY08_00557 [Olleya aquimaris]
MFTQKKNKKFNYQTRFSKDNDSATKLKESMNSSWNDARRTSSSNRKNYTLFLLLGVLALLAILMYYLETKIK